MKDFAIDTHGKFIMNGLDISINSDLESYAAQSLQIQLRTFLGEWYLNTTVGIAYFTDVFGKGINLKMVEAALKNQIVSNSFVDSITAIKVAYDNSLRKLICTFSAKLTNGTTIGVTI